MAPEVAASIVVPSRGGASRLPVLLSALARQDTDDFEVIVVVDGDIDGSANALGNISTAHDLRLRRVIFPKNRGRSTALNAGAELAVGRVLIRCDDDLEPDPRYVSTHLAQHNVEPTGVVGLARNVFPDTAYARVYGSAADTRFRAQAAETPAEHQWRYWGGNVSVPLTVHQSIGGYDEAFRTYGWEDVDYGYRLHKAGIPVRVVPELTTAHHIASTTTAIRASRALHSGASREIFLQKHGPMALPEGTSQRGLWNRLVAGGARVATAKNLRLFGGVVDSLSLLLPHPVAEKLVALTVESAGLAGIRYPQRAKERF